MPTVKGPIQIKKGSLPKIPVFLSPVQAGFPSPADDYLEKPLDFNKELIKHPAATFAFRIVGDSMVGVGIHSGDKVIVDKAARPKPGDIVIVALNNEWTVKKLAVQDKRPKLLPANPNYKEITVSELTDFRIFGVVKHVIHSF